MTDPVFSVIVPSYGRATLLGEALASVLMQTFPDFECIVVDDGGEETRRVPDDPRVRLVRRAVNGGTAAARNTGLAEARGRYVTFLDDDDLYAQDRLEMVLPALHHARVAVCWVRFVGGPKRPGRTLEGDVRGTILDGLLPHVGATTVPRELAPPFDETMRSVEDVDWWLRLAHAAAVTTVPRFGYLYRLHDAPRHGKGPAERVRNNLHLIERYAEYFAAHPRAAAFRWRRIGLLAARAGDHRTARRAFVRAARLYPSPKASWRVLRSLPGVRLLFEAISRRRRRPTGTGGDLDTAGREVR